jgi:hypothetical protein
MDDKTALDCAQEQDHPGTVTLLQAWPNMLAIWTLRAAVGRPKIPEIGRLPNELCRMIGDILI